MDSDRRSGHDDGDELRPGTDPRLARVVGLVARVEGTAKGVARLATLAAIAGAVGGLVLWGTTTGHRVDDDQEGTVVALLVLVLCLAPAVWLVNVRFSLLALLELPGKLSGVTVKRGTQLLGAPRLDLPATGSVPVRKTGRLATIRSLRGVVRDYGDVVGSWATVAQLLAPTFWALTVLALLAVPVVIALAALAGLVKVLT